MSAITRERVAEIIHAAGLEPCDYEEVFGSIKTGEIVAMARIALASLEAEPAIHRWRRVTVEPYGPYPWHYGNFIGFSKSVDGIEDEYFYSVPPAPVSVPDLLEQFAEFMAAESIKSGDYPDGWQCKASNAAHEYAQNIRAAMLQCADTELQRKAAIHDVLCAKYNVESLADFVDWQRNHIAELEAAPPAPVGHGEAAVMPDYPGYVMTQRECFQAGKKAGLTEAGNAPVIPDGLRLALSNAGIAAPESDEMLAATCEKHIQALVTWVKDRKPFQPAVIQDGWVACSERMPERDVDVQVYCADKKEQMVGYMERNEQDGYFRFASLPNGGGVYCQPTHWTPLPAAPQQK
ncbi:DUF551 domain-containing protein [Enterobacter mori]|uniref:DUF551 domain-containing protein n=1 Tax=Enterobacter mori TaxID=539813 RepID=UPI003D6E0771